jgi:hypothetical protein
VALIARTMSRAGPGRAPAGGGGRERELRGRVGGDSGRDRPRLAMRRADFFVPPEERDRVVSRYSRAGGAIRAMSLDPFAREARHVSGGGGLHTTIGD